MLSPRKASLLKMKALVSAVVIVVDAQHGRESGLYNAEEADFLERAAFENYEDWAELVDAELRAPRNSIFEMKETAWSYQMAV